MAARRTGLPLVTTFHGFYGARTAPKRLYNSSMIRGDKVIAGSQFMARHIVATYHCPPDRVVTIPRGIDIEKFDPRAVDPARVQLLRGEWRIPENSHVALLPARLTRWKGQLLLLDALAALDRPDLIAVFVGDPQGREAYVTELHDRTRELGLEGQVRIIGHCADMPAAMLAADVIVSASTDAEAFGRVPVEAMAMGRPIVAADHGGAAETLRSERGATFGELFPAGDSAALADALTKALTQQSVAADARQHVVEHYSTAVMCARTLALYRELVPA